MTEQTGLSLVTSGLATVQLTMNPDSLSPRLQSLVQNTRATLEQAVREYGDVVYSNSLGAEAMVLTDIICAHVPEIGMFTLDTGRLHATSAASKCSTRMAS